MRVRPAISSHNRKILESYKFPGRQAATELALSETTNSERWAGLQRNASTVSFLFRRVTMRGAYGETRSSISAGLPSARASKRLPTLQQRGYRDTRCRSMVISKEAASPNARWRPSQKELCQSIEMVSGMRASSERRLAVSERRARWQRPHYPWRVMGTPT